MKRHRGRGRNYDLIAYIVLRTIRNIICLVYDLYHYYVIDYRYD